MSTLPSTFSSSPFPVPPRSPLTSRPRPTLDTALEIIDQPVKVTRSPESVSSSPIDSEMPPSASPRKSHSSPSQHLPPFLTMKRSNPKRLSLSLFVPPTTSPVSSLGDMSVHSTETTPFTPGPPKTPALAMSTMTLGRATKSSKSGRPSLLSLITREELAGSDNLPTPGGVRPLVSRPKRTRAQSDTTGNVIPTPAGFRSAQPTLLSFPVINELDSGSLTDATAYFTSTDQSSSPGSSSLSSLGCSSSTASSSSSPPLCLDSFAPIDRFPMRSNEPYADGPVEILPGIFLGSEESTYDLSWARHSRRVRILNVALEIDDPFVGSHSLKGKEKQGDKWRLASYNREDGLDIDYCHLSWSHGEERLAEMPACAMLDDLLRDDAEEHDIASWTFWHAIRWIESARRNDIPVLIHCQCGVSRSATLTIAYLMTLAAAGLLPQSLGHLKCMQDVYDMVKTKSPSIGPNVQLVFQLVEYGRNLTTLLSAHYAQSDPRPIATSFPTAEDVAMSEAEWARKRREFEDSESEERSVVEAHSPNAVAMNDARTANWCCVLGSPMSSEEAGDEARRWDDAMVQRRLARSEACLLGA
ncbi:protein-tyrosine phosphatase-like protein [Kockovaella imperatae]|uniref:protein-tyrosine-phosphatase n=1 Tax=Kockovaella imperatae TaxID=4999 RepID=A0A1Y1UDR7_9TREE|nr:protein-tyrosine phosphatase-like protein [Kockovaella imperatae]ORX36152.1 protein-tyrosine phosphatase-like protein [Kockovaella imperatae]